MTMHFGTVVSYNPETGQGLIAPDGGTAPLPVTRAAISAAGLGQLAEQQRVGFDIAANGNGPDGTETPAVTNLWTTWSQR